MRGLRLFALAAIVCAKLVSLQPEGVFRTTTELVHIDVAAEDKNGKPVTDLTKDDFELLVNNKPRSIDTFSVATAAPPVELAPLPRGTFSNKQVAAEAAQSRYIVFLVDRRNTNCTLQMWAHDQLVKMLAEAPPNGKLALYIIDNGLQIVQDFTRDRDLMSAQVQGMISAPPPPLTPGLDLGEAAANETVRAFQDLARHLSGIPGQKVVLWMSTGFPDKEPQTAPPPGSFPVGLKAEYAAPDTSFLQTIDKAVHILGNANIVLESVEASYLGATVLTGCGPISSYLNPLHMIAERTGGRFFPGDNNDLAGTMKIAANDHAAGYELGYYLGDEQQRPGLAPFEIRSKRPGVTLRYREGYFVEKNPPKPESDREVAQDVLEAAVDATSIPLTAKATRTAGNISNIMLRVNVDAHALTLRQDANGLWGAKISTYARFASDVEDQVGDVPLDSPRIAMSEEQYQKALKEGFNLRFTMRIPADAVKMRVLVRDEDSGNSGSVTVPLGDLPEF